MPCNPLRDEHVKQLCANLRGATTEDGQRLIAKWLADDRITKQELVSGLTMYERARLLGAPEVPFPNVLSAQAETGTGDGNARLVAYEQAHAEWKRAFLASER
jgi:hypothetical protein